MILKKKAFVLDTAPAVDEHWKLGGGPLRRRLTAFFGSRGLPLRLAILCSVLASPSLFIGLHLDDYVHRYFILELPGADLLTRSYVSLYGIANGDPQQNHWLIEEGFAPWWTHERLLLSFFRPLSVWTHRIDYLIWPDNAVLMHAHSLLWLGAAAAAAALYYQSILGTTTSAGFAAYLYAVDHTHGLAAGWLANRNALVAVTFAVLALVAHNRQRRNGSTLAAVAGPVCLLLGLLGGELAVGAWAYLVAHAVVLDGQSWKSRARGLAPYAAVSLGWLIVRASMGYGARASGLYLDPIQDPLLFGAALLERVPLLVLGQFGLPPAETHHFVSPDLAFSIFVLALAVLAAAVVTLLPFARKNRMARFWAAGALLALPPACTAYSHNRMLFFVGLGCMALLALLLRDALTRAAWLPHGKTWHLVAQPFLAGTLLLHALVSPLLLPLAACSVASTNLITRRGVPSAMAALPSPAAELVIVSAPEYFSVNLIPIVQRLEKRPEPARLRALSVGPVALAVRRIDERRLEIEYEGGLLADPLSQLYRNARLPMQTGQKVGLRGLAIEVTKLTADGRPAAASFVFEADLDSGRYAWVVWEGNQFVPFRLPKVGSIERVPVPRVAFDRSFGFASD